MVSNGVIPAGLGSIAPNSMQLNLLITHPRWDPKVVEIWVKGSPDPKTRRVDPKAGLLGIQNRLCKT